MQTFSYFKYVYVCSKTISWGLTFAQKICSTVPIAAGVGFGVAVAVAVACAVAATHLTQTFSLIRDCMCESEFNLVLSLDACAWAQFLDWRHPISDLEITDYRTPIDMVLLKVIKYLVG